MVLEGVGVSWRSKKVLDKAGFLCIGKRLRPGKLFDLSSVFFWRSIHNHVNVHTRKLRHRRRFPQPRRRTPRKFLCMWKCFAPANSLICQAFFLAEYTQPHERTHKKASPQGGASHNHVGVHQESFGYVEVLHPDRLFDLLGFFWRSIHRSADVHQESFVYAEALGIFSVRVKKAFGFFLAPITACITL